MDEQQLKAFIRRILKQDGYVPGGGGSPLLFPTPTTGDRVDLSNDASDATVTADMALNTLRAVLVRIPSTKAFTTAANINATTLGGNVRVALYNVSAAGYPTTLICESNAAISILTAGVKAVTLSAAPSLTANTIIAIAWNSDSATGVLRGHNLTQTVPIPNAGAAMGATVNNGWTIASTFGAMPATFTAGATATNLVPPVILLTAA